MAWLTEDDEALVTGLWADAPYDASVRHALIEAAQAQCEVFAGSVPSPEARHKMAVILQARALQRSTVAGSGDSMGGEFTVTVFPMDWTVKALLRPATGVPVMA